MSKIMQVKEKTFPNFSLVLLMMKLMTMWCVKQLTMVVCIRSSTNCWTLALKAVVELSSTWWRKPEVPLTVWPVQKAPLLGEAAANWATYLGAQRAQLPSSSVPLTLHPDQATGNRKLQTDRPTYELVFDTCYHCHALIIETLGSPHLPTAAQASAAHVSHGEAKRLGP